MNYIFSILLIIFVISSVVLQENSGNKDDIVNQENKKLINSNSEVNETQLLLYTRNNPINPIEIHESNVNLLEKKKKNVLIIHGLDSSPSELDFPDLRKKYLERYDSNVIMVNYSIIAAEFYPIAIIKLPNIAELIAKVLCEINKQSNISLIDFHLVGHSLGGQLSGLIGQSTQNICKQHIGRITALDPAGPIYQLFPENKRLDKSDALFLDVIHTNELFSGYYGNLGHIDFHVNCGTRQSGCPQLDLKNISSLEAMNICSHVRSISYMVESITSDNFTAQSCSSCPYICKGDKNPEYVTMGEDCSMNSKNQVFWIPTNPTSPYAAGCSLYENGCS